MLVLPTPPFTDAPSGFTELALPHWLLPQRLGQTLFTLASLFYTIDFAQQYRDYEIHSKLERWD